MQAHAELLQKRKKSKANFKGKIILSELHLNANRLEISNKTDWKTILLGN